MPMDAYVTLPIEPVVRLYSMIDNHDKDQSEIIQIRRELEGLRNMQHECFQILGDLRKELKSIERQGLRP